MNRRLDKVQTESSPTFRQSKRFAVNATRSNFTTGNTSVDARSRPCANCSAQHPLWKCEAFLLKDVDSRWSLAKSAKLCFNCLGNHVARNCKSNSRCRHCRGLHHNLLHRDLRPAMSQMANPGSSDGAGDLSSTETRGENSTAIPAAYSTGVISNTRSKVRLKVIPVKVWSSSNRKCESVYAFLDEGSDTTLCSKALLNRLGAKGKAVHFSLSTVSGTDHKHGHDVKLFIQGYNEATVIELPSVLSVPCLPDLKSSIPSGQDLISYADVLQGVSLPEVLGGIELLIGADIPEAHRTLEYRISQVGGPNAVRTMLGWSLVGPTNERLATQTPEFRVNFVRSESSMLHEQMQRVYDTMHKQMIQMYQQDFNEGTDSSKMAMSVEDRRALAIMQDCTQLQNGHYIIPLPWKSNQVKLPRNRTMAERRLAYLRAKLLRDKDLFHNYKDKIKEYLDKGYARKVPTDLLPYTDRTWFIPHHATVGKFRVVFDCAARFQGVSLNDNLLQGPDHTSNLMGVLLRFRKKPIAVVADIRGMFHQVRVKPRDCDSLRFLWWPDGDLSVPPQEYQMLVHLFGATSSPSCCGFALRKVASDRASEVDPLVVNSILRSFYVDDFLGSFATTEEAEKVIRSLKKVLKEAGFDLTKFRSNKNAILKTVPEEDRLGGVSNLDLNKASSDRTLGVSWNTQTDQFEIRVCIKEKPVTRRGILSMMSQVFDPMGIIHPFLLPAKRLMQELCSENSGWDDEISEEKRQAWFRWLDSSQCLNSVKFPRCLHPPNFRPAKFQLHCFCDASSVGYGAVAYLRMIDSLGAICCCFLMGKSRVAPLKPVTIPRMELTAAVVGVNLVKFLRNELDLELESVTFWTDSTSVLQYINNTAKRFHVFVANRIVEIHAVSDPSQWRHLDSKSNPADICSRGLMPEQLNKAEAWFVGPPFLKLPEKHWPEQPTLSPKLDGLEIRTRTNATLAQGTHNSALDRLLNSSSFSGLKRKVAWLLRYRQYLLAKSQPNVLVSTRFHSLTVSELEVAAREIIKLVQRQSFPEEVSKLARSVSSNSCQPDSLNTKSCSVSKHSCLRKLCPIFVQGLIRVGGRLQRSPFSLDVKHPIILPKNHHVTHLIIKFFHQKEGHSGVQHTLAATRAQFWVINGHATVRKVLNECRICRLKYPVSGSQIMAPLPVHRVTPGKPAFTCVGVDYAGPFFIKAGRTTLKRYLCVFTCLATRAVHLEPSFSLDTPSFLQTYQRFISRRGTPQTIYSDNGSNFVGAVKELRDGFKRLDKQAICDRLSRQSIEWRFNPPAASHQGGVWERVIRSVRKIMLALTDQQRQLTDEEFFTFAAEVERILNNRPLTSVSSDPTDLEALTPNSLLLCRLDDSIPLDVFMKADKYKRSWRFVNWLADQFWLRWTKEYLPTLQIRQKWLQPARNLRVGDVVMVIDDVGKRGSWPKARVEEVFPGKDGYIRSARVRTATSSFLRDTRKLCLLEAAE